MHCEKQIQKLFGQLECHMPYKLELHGQILNLLNLISLLHHSIAALIPEREEQDSCSCFFLGSRGPGITPARNMFSSRHHFLRGKLSIDMYMAPQAQVDLLNGSNQSTLSVNTKLQGTDENGIPPGFMNSFHNLPSYYTCLLYTSPSPRDATLSRMPSSA